MELEQAKKKFNYQHIKLIKNRLVFFDKTEKRKLLSVSSITNLFIGWKFDLIPDFILNKAKDVGNSINELIEHFLTNNINDFDRNNKFYKVVENLIPFIKQNKPLCLEKLVLGDIFYGFIDIECEKCFFELKSRNYDIPDLTTILQCEIYKKLCGKEYFIIQINKQSQKSFIFTSQNIPKDLLEKAQEIINSIEKISTILQN